MPSYRAQLIQAHIRQLQAKLASRANAPKPRVRLELDPGELDFFRRFEGAPQTLNSPTGSKMVAEK